MKTAFIFSGQGAQKAGMGKELYDNFECVKKVFDEADEALGLKISDICFNEDERLNETEYTQPAILTMSVAVLKLMEEKGLKADYVAGLSLGEYSAHVASGTFDFADAVQLVRKAVMLNVSGPFHTSLLAPASEKLNAELQHMTIKDMNIPVITNLTADVVPSKDEVIDILTKQVMNPVKWEQSVRKMIELGVDTFVEMGPGKTLSSFVKKISKDVAVYNVEDLKSLEKTCGGLGC